MALEMVSGADFWCKLTFRASPGDLGGPRVKSRGAGYLKAVWLKHSGRFSWVLGRRSTPGPPRSPGLARNINLHQKSAPETNSKAKWWRTCYHSMEGRAILNSEMLSGGQFCLRVGATVCLQCLFASDASPETHLFNLTEQSAAYVAAPLPLYGEPPGPRQIHMSIAELPHRGVGETILANVVPEA